MSTLWKAGGTKSKASKSKIGDILYRAGVESKCLMLNSNSATRTMKLCPKNITEMGGDLHRSMKQIEFERHGAGI